MSQAFTDQDTPWKEALEGYLPECLLFFFPQVHAAIDWSRPHEFLDKELQQVVRDAHLGRRIADKLVKVHLLSGQEQWLLIHLEVQGKRDKTLPQRMFIYYYRIAERYQQPVISLAILSDTHPRWRPHQYIEAHLGCRLEFTFLVVKLLDYRSGWADLEASANPFAIVVMAHLKAQETRGNDQRRKTWKLAIVRRLYERGYNREQILTLFHVIDWMMTLPDEMEQEIWQEMQQWEERMPYVSSVERIGIKKGWQDGLQEGLKQERERLVGLVVKVLQNRFGPIPSKLEARLHQLSLEQLTTAFDGALQSESLKLFIAQLPKVKAAKRSTPLQDG